jgi:hypothetical protein
VSEVLSNGVTLSLNAPGSTTATFAPTPSLFVMNDQIDFVGASGGTSTTSALTNAFSLVPTPIVGAGLPAWWPRAEVFSPWRDVVIVGGSPDPKPVASFTLANVLASPPAPLFLSRSLRT